MDEDMIFINSAVCNKFTRYRGAREEIAAGVDALQYFDRVALYHYVPLLNTKLPKGCEMAYDFPLRSCKGGHCVAVQMNDALKKAVDAANKKDSWGVWCDYEETYAYLKHPKGTDKICIKPNFSNDNSLKLSAYFTLIGWNLERDDVSQKLYAELTKRYNEMGRFNSLNISRFKSPDFRSLTIKES